MPSNLARPLRPTLTLAFTSTRAMQPAARALHITGAQPSPVQLQSQQFVAKVMQAGRSSDKTSTRPLTSTPRSQSTHDTSTIDFAYMPTFPPPTPNSFTITRIPLLPDTANPNLTHPNLPQAVRTHSAVAGVAAAAGIDAVHRAQITTAAGSAGDSDVHVSAMSEVVDGSGEAISESVFGMGLTEMVARAREGAGRVVGVEAGEERGAVGRVWGGFVEDLLGKGGVSKA